MALSFPKKLLRPYYPLYRVSLGFTALWAVLAAFMVLRPVATMQALFRLGSVHTLQDSASMAAGFSRYVILVGAGLWGVLVLKSLFLWLWYRKRKTAGLILYVFLNLCLVVFSQYAAINYYGFFYAVVPFPAAGILLHVLSLRAASEEPPDN